MWWYTRSATYFPSVGFKSGLFHNDNAKYIQFPDIQYVEGEQQHSRNSKLSDMKKWLLTIMFVRFYRFFIASHDIAIEASKTVWHNLIKIACCLSLLKTKLVQCISVHHVRHFGPKLLGSIRTLFQPCWSLLERMDITKSISWIFISNNKQERKLNVSEKKFRALLENILSPL